MTKTTYADVKAERRRKRLLSSGLPKRFHDADIATLEMTDANAEALTTVQAYLDDIKEYADAGKGLLLYGPSGRGKTTLAACVLRYALNHGATGLYMPASRYQHIAMGQFNLRRDDEDSYDEYLDNRKIMSRCLTSLFLVLDDLGKEHAGRTGYIEAEFQYLLRERFDASHPTLLTTNVRPIEFAKVYGDSMESFIHEAFLLVAVGGDDYRRRAP